MHVVIYGKFPGKASMANFNSRKIAASLKYLSIRVERTKIPKSVRMWRLLNLVKFYWIPSQGASQGVRLWG